MFIQHGTNLTDEKINITKLSEEAEKSFGEVLFKKFVNSATTNYSRWDDEEYSHYGWGMH
jgi:hypothetical protein